MLVRVVSRLIQGYTQAWQFRQTEQLEILCLYPVLLPSSSLTSSAFDCFKRFGATAFFGACALRYAPRNVKRRRNARLKGGLKAPYMKGFTALDIWKRKGTTTPNAWGIFFRMTLMTKMSPKAGSQQRAKANTKMNSTLDRLISWTLTSLKDVKIPALCSRIVLKTW